HAAHQQQLVHRLEGAVFAPVVGVRLLLGAVLGRRLVGVAPVDNGGGDVGRHARQHDQLAQAGGVDVDLGALVVHAEVLDPVLLAVGADDPEVGVADGYG